MSAESEAEIDWKADAHAFAEALADIAAKATLALGCADDPAALIERGKILAFLHMAIASTKGDGPIKLVVLDDELPVSDRRIVPAITVAVIKGLIEGIEQGLHREAEVRLVRVMPGKETKQ